MSKKRTRRDVQDPALKDYNTNATKRLKYDLRCPNKYDLQMRDCCSLPQYNKPYQHNYHLRPFDHRKPGTKQSLHKPPDSAVTRGSGVCAKTRTIAEGVIIRRNAHSYSINGHMARCSNSSTASGRQRTLQALKKGAVAAAGKKAVVKKEVS